MITNRCLTGGSLDVEPPPVDPGPLPSAPAAGSGALGAGAGLATGVVGLSAGGGVGVDSASGGSLGDPDDEVLAVDGGDAAGAVVGRTSFSGWEDAARLPLTREAAAPPRITPKPRNTSTRKAEILAGGSRSAAAEASSRGWRRGAAGGGAPCGPAAAPAEPSRAASPCLNRSCTRRRTSASWGLRGPIRDPQPKQ